MPRMIDGEDVRKLQAQLGLNQTQLAKKLGVDQSTVSRWLRGAEIGPKHQDALKVMIDEAGREGSNAPSRTNSTPPGASHVRAPTGISLTGKLRSLEPDETPELQNVWELVEATVRMVFPFAADRLPKEDEVLALVRLVIADLEARTILPPRSR
jgi:transcriptional regulator with XRE-family HTH domain